MTPASYGQSPHYAGDNGVRYFNWQNQFSDVHGKIEARKFQPYVTPTDVVIDFGCGGGSVLAELAAGRKIGVEIGDAARDHARSRGLEVFDSLDPVADESVDVVISNHALEHVPYPIGALAEMRRVLKEGGLLVLCVPIDDWRNHRAFDPADMNHHLHTWTVQLLGNSLVDSGFEPAEIAIDVLTHAWFPGYRRLWTHEAVFDLLGRWWARLTRQRQLFARARKGPRARRA
jgi:SAM-dependent methyltransferase